MASLELRCEVEVSGSESELSESEFEECAWESGDGAAIARSLLLLAVNVDVPESPLARGPTTTCWKSQAEG